MRPADRQQDRHRALRGRQPGAHDRRSGGDSRRQAGAPDKLRDRGRARGGDRAPVPRRPA